MLVNNQNKALVVNGNALVVDDSNIIYELYNHTCDGTVATAINTGIYLFDTTLYPNGWTIELEFSFTAHVSQGSVIRCRNASSPYNGINVRNTQNSGLMEAQINGGAVQSTYVMGSRETVLFDYDVATNICSVRLNMGNTTSQSMSGKTVNPPLVVGGENNDDSASFSWKSGRFPKCVIHSLVITSK